jgi:glycosyltransferase involved in cell wall biosynthesis
VKTKAKRSGASFAPKARTGIAMNASPRVSVLIPSFNHARYVADAIGSVQKQNYTNWEIVIVDDCSSDDSAAIIQNFNDPRIIFLQNERNIGINPTLVRALTASTGSLISMLASDDMLLPDKFERQIAAIRRSGADVIYGNGIQLLEDGTCKNLDLSAFARDFAAGKALCRAYTDDTGLPLLQSALFRREVFETLNVYREQVKLDDWITLIKVLEEFRVDFVDEPVFVYRQHPANTFRRYEYTLGLRLEIIAHAVPSAYRREALSRLFASQANYLAWDGRFIEALRFIASSQSLRPDLAGATLFARAVLSRIRHGDRR